MFIAMNRLTVPADYRSHLEERFAGSGARMKDVPGCLEFQFLIPTEGDEVIVYTKWESEASFTAWTQGESFQRAHQGSNPNSPVKGDLRLYNVKFSS
ncbi:antibiotic biosynthesis monooxygenase family protein [Tumebacillus lipolyticus]|uniref:Antibiotic biosynthesis monooxygenase family protein n=1 Tax=Tumebacillus lipolyticus TaxID=1280370 RepID=A0ABW4ZZP9_9BACL